ncbi:MAG: DUF4911 domain-containing protein [Desulfovibrio sp.]|nr:DUF4911 domain-containing protein [Desulfovibrio sp.]
MRSETLYLRLPRAQVAFFRFLLEAREGLAMFTSLGADAQGREVLRLLFAPGGRPGVRAFLADVQIDCGLEILAG